MDKWTKKPLTHPKRESGYETILNTFVFLSDCLKDIAFSSNLYDRLNRSFKLLNKIPPQANLSKGLSETGILYSKCMNEPH